MKLRNNLYTPQEIVAYVIQKLKIDAESFLQTRVSEAVLTVPSRFGLAQIEALREAGELAGLNVRRIVTEPTAACLAHGLFSSKNDVRVYVFDLGGGSLDVSIIETGDGVFEVLSTYGDIDLGGDDFDFAQWS